LNGTAPRLFLPDGDNTFGGFLPGDCRAVLVVERAIDLVDVAELVPSRDAGGGVFLSAHSGCVFVSLLTLDDATGELLGAFLVAFDDATGELLGTFVDAFVAVLFEVASLLLVVVPALEGLFFLEDEEEAADFAMMLLFFFLWDI
jgi:hypothetical protein